MLSNNTYPLYKTNVNIRFYKCMKSCKQSKKKQWKKHKKSLLVLFCNMCRHLLFRVCITYRRLDFTLRKNFRVRASRVGLNPLHYTAVLKVHIFWEGHTILRNLHFWLALHRTKVRWRFPKILWPSQNI